MRCAICRGKATVAINGWKWKLPICKRCREISGRITIMALETQVFPEKRAEIIDDAIETMLKKHLLEEDDYGVAE